MLLFFFNTTASYSHCHIASSLSLYVDDTSPSLAEGGNKWATSRCPSSGWLDAKETPSQTLSLTPGSGAIPDRLHVRRLDGGFSLVSMGYIESWLLQMHGIGNVRSSSTSIEINLSKEDSPRSSR